MSTTKQTILITGGNTGLGLEIVKALYASPSPYNIIIGSRTPSNADKAIATVQAETPTSASSLSAVQIDISSDDSISAARKHIEPTFNGTLDILINNAGANFDRDFQSGQLSLREMWNKSWDTNVAGTVVTTTEFVPLLLKSSNPRLIFVTSGTASVAETEKDDPPIFARINGAPEAGWPKPQEGNPIAGYRSSKAGLNMMMRNWARVLKKDGVKVWAVSPGFLVTGLSNFKEEELKKMGAQDASVGGNFMREVVEGKYDHQTGKVIRSNMIQPY